MKLGLPHHSRPYLLQLHPPHLLSESMRIHCWCQTALKITEAAWWIMMRRKGATSKLIGCWFINILKFNGHFNRKRTFNKIHPTHLTTSCLGLSDSSLRPPRRTTVWKQLISTRNSLYTGKGQAPNPSLPGNSPSNKHTLENWAQKMQNVASINRTAAAQNAFVVCERSIRL